MLPLTSLITGPLLARVLGPEGRGEMAAVLAPIFVITIAASMAVPDATTYAVAKSHFAPKRIIISATVLLLAYGALGAAILFFVAPLLLRESPEAIPLLRTAAWTLPLLMIVAMWRSAANGLRRFQLVNLERTVGSISRLAVLVVLAIASALTASTAVWTNIVTTVLAALILIVPIMRAAYKHNSPLQSHSTRGQNLQLYSQLATYGFLGGGAVLANLVNWRLDQALLALFVEARDIGFYAVAVSLSELPAMIIGSLRNIVFAESTHRADLHLVARATRIVAATTAVVVIVAVPTAPYVVRVLFGSAFAPATQLAQILFLALIPLVTERVLGTGLLAAGRPGLRSIGQVFAALTTVVGLFIIVPKIGVVGAALTSALAYTISVVVTLVLFSRASSIPIKSTLLISRHDVAWLRGHLRDIAHTRSRRRPSPDE